MNLIDMQLTRTREKI